MAATQNFYKTAKINESLVVLIRNFACKHYHKLFKTIVYKPKSRIANMATVRLFEVTFDRFNVDSLYLSIV
jgi:hypothetical protein